MFQPQQQAQQQQPPQQFVQQHRKSHIMPPTVASQNEVQCKEKLAGYVYEYLVLAGAQKSADAFKNEVLANIGLSQISVSPADAPGFLINWFSIFWDLFAAAPERRDKMDSSAEAKAFHELFIPPSTFNPGHLINGVHPNPQFGNGGAPPMGIPPNELPNYFRNNPSQGPVANQSSPIAGGPRGYGGQAAGARSGAPTPSNVMGAGGAANGPPNFPPGAPSAHMFNEMRNMVQAQRINANGPRMPNFNPTMRQMRPGFPGGVPQFIDSPSGTPPFPQNPGMMPNGMCSLMSSPGSQPGQNGPVGPGGPGGGASTAVNSDAAHDPRFMMMGGGASNIPGQFSIGHHDGGAGTPTSMSGANNASAGFNGSAGGVMHGGGGNPSENPSVSGVGPLQSLLNGGGGGPSGAGGNGAGEMEMKQSPSSHMNGGTPGGAGHMNPGSIQPQQQQPPTGGGPASVHGCHGDPGSVHSQQGGGGPMGSVVGPAGPSSQQSYQTPTSEAPQSSMDFQPQGNQGCDEEQEISKIKRNLIEGFDGGFS